MPKPWCICLILHMAEVFSPCSSCQPIRFSVCLFINCSLVWIFFLSLCMPLLPNQSTVFFFSQWAVGTVKSLSAVSGFVWYRSCLYNQHSWSTSPCLSHVCHTRSLWVWWMNAFARHIMMGIMRHPRASALNAVFASNLPSTCIVLPIKKNRRLVNCPSSLILLLIVRISHPTDALPSSSCEPSDAALMSLPSHIRSIIKSNPSRSGGKSTSIHMEKQTNPTSSPSQKLMQIDGVNDNTIGERRQNTEHSTC